jgi:hypothetical protein
LAKTKINLVVGGIETRTPSEFLKQRFKEEEKIKAEIREKLKPIIYRSEKYDPKERNYKELTYEEKRSEENEFIAYQRLKTDVHRDYKGTFTWLLFRARKELAFKKSEPFFFSRYGHIFSSKDLPTLLDLCWEMEVYGHCIFYDQKRYDSKTLRRMIHDLRHAKEHLSNVREIMVGKDSDRKKHTPEQLPMFGKSQNVGITFDSSLKNELQILDFELADLLRIANDDLKLPAPTKDKEQIKLQYFIYLCEEIFKRINWDLFPNCDLSNKTTYNRECKNFILDMASLLDEIKKTNPSTITNAYDRKAKYKMKYLGLMKCESEKQFNNLLKKIGL